MYSTFLMVAMTASPATPEFGYHGGWGYGYGGWGGGYGYWGGGYGYGYGHLYGHLDVGYGYGFGYVGGLGYGFSGGAGYLGIIGYAGGLYRFAWGYNPGPVRPVYFYSNFSVESPLPPYAAVAPPQRTPDNFQPPMPAPVMATAKATLEVSLPPEARLFVDSNAMASNGAVRRLTSPPIEAGREFIYTLTATLMRDGSEVKVERRVTVRAGQTTQVALDFPLEVARR